MRKNRPAIWAVLSLILLAGLALPAAGRKPFKKVEASEIISASVHLTPPDKTVQIAEPETLTELLRDAVIYRRDPSYSEYAGQGVTFSIFLADGTRTEIMAYNPFLVIDGVGYRTKYGPCEALNAYANRLLEEGDAAIISEEPRR